MNNTHEEIIALAVRLNSITEAAKLLGISKQRVSQIVPTGMISSQVTRTCIDCGKVWTAKKFNDNQRCSACSDYFRRHGLARTPENKAQVRAAAAKIVAAKNRRQYCANGHERIPENLYKSGNCRLCASTPEAKAKQNAYYRHRYHTDEAFRKRRNQHSAAYRRRKQAT